MPGEIDGVCLEDKGGFDPVHLGYCFGSTKVLDIAQLLVTKETSRLGVILSFLVHFRRMVLLSGKR